MYWYWTIYLVPLILCFSTVYGLIAYFDAKNKERLG
jgi:hypothetical protein